jgi:hypothetical protein
MRNHVCRLLSSICIFTVFVCVCGSLWAQATLDLPTDF